MRGPPLDLLVIETFSWSPHLETAGEICLAEHAAGAAVGFVFLHVDNPDADISAPRLSRRIGRYTRRKAGRLQALLADRGVVQVPEPRLPRRCRHDAARFGRSRVADLADLQALTYQGAALGAGAASSLVLNTCDSDPDLRANRALVARYLRSAALVYEATQLLLERVRPTAVMVFNGRFACTRPIVEAARRAGVPCSFHERGATFEHYEIFRRPPHDFAYLRDCVRAAWTEAGPDRERIAESFFRRSRSGQVLDWLDFTEGQQRGRVPARGDRRRLVYFSSSDDEFTGAGDLLDHPLFGSQREAVQFLVDWVATQPDAELIIRVHPYVLQKAARDRDWWTALQGGRVRVEGPDSPTDSYALAESADAVLTYSSTIGIEAAMLGRPVILLGDSAYRGFGCVHEPANREDLLSLLSRSDLSALPREACLPYGYYRMTHGRRFRYYEPDTLFRGRFLGVDLDAEADLRSRLRNSWLGTAVRALRARRTAVTA
jgi:hypothetical protein